MKQNVRKYTWQEIRLYFWFLWKDIQIGWVRFRSARTQSKINLLQMYEIRLTVALKAATVSANQTK